MVAHCLVILKRVRSIQTGRFQYIHKIFSKFGYDPKESHDCTLIKRLDPKKWEMAPFSVNMLGIRVMCGKGDKTTDSVHPELIFGLV